MDINFAVLQGTSRKLKLMLNKLKFLNSRQTSICYELLFLICLLFFFQYLQVPECWKVWAKSIWRTRSDETSLWEGNNLKIKLNIAFFSTISLRKKWNILKVNPLFFLERGIFLSCKQSVQIKKPFCFIFSYSTDWRTWLFIIYLWAVLSALLESLWQAWNWTTVH